MLSDGYLGRRRRCAPPSCGLAASPGALEKAEYQNRGICVGEFEDYFGMGQSRISYHMRKLKDAGLLREERRGKWSFYSLDEEAVRRLLDIARVQLSA